MATFQKCIKNIKLEPLKNSVLPKKKFSTSHCFVEYGTKLIHNNEGSHSDSFRINLESFKTFRNCLSHKPVTERELFLGGRRYTELALKGQLREKANSTVFI